MNSITEWEYMTLSANSDDTTKDILTEMNRLGLEGWELVSVVTRVGGGNTQMYRHYLKRIKAK